MQIRSHPGFRSLFGVPGQPLTGPESRALRTALNLERRHVVAMCNALKFRDDETTAQIVTAWERGKDRGYPDNVAIALSTLETGVERLALGWAQFAFDSYSNSNEIDGKVWTLRRPLGAKRILTLLAPADDGLIFSEAALQVLDQSGGDFWLALADAALSRAATILAREGFALRVVLDREPD